MEYIAAVEARLCVYIHERIKGYLMNLEKKLSSAYLLLSLRERGAFRVSHKFNVHAGEGRRGKPQTLQAWQCR